MIPLAIPNLAGREGEYLQACVEENFVSTVGRFVVDFEEGLAKASESKHAIAVSQGTTGLHAALTALGVDTGDLVIIPSLTFIASANAVAHCKALPWILDVTEESWTLDPENLAKALMSDCERTDDGGVLHKPSGRQVKAVMPVHTMGHPPDMDRITEIAKDWNLPVIADAAAALGNVYKGRAPGDTGADVSVMSFNGNKIITTGGGGAIICNDVALAQDIRHLTTTARVWPNYEHNKVGFNYRMTNVQAAIGVAQLELLEGFVAAKRRIAATYEKAWQYLDGASGFPQADWGESNHWFSGIFLPDLTSNEMAGLRSHLKEGNVDARPFWMPIHMQKPYLHAPRSLTSISQSRWENILPLPCSTQLTHAEQEHVISTVYSYFK